MHFHLSVFLSLDFVSWQLSVSHYHPCVACCLIYFLPHCTSLSCSLLLNPFFSVTPPTIPLLPELSISLCISFCLPLSHQSVSLWPLSFSSFISSAVSCLSASMRWAFPLSFVSLPCSFSCLPDIFCLSLTSLAWCFFPCLPFYILPCFASFTFSIPHVLSHLFDTFLHFLSPSCFHFLAYAFPTLLAISCSWHSTAFISLSICLLGFFFVLEVFSLPPLLTNYLSVSLLSALCVASAFVFSCLRLSLDSSLHSICIYPSLFSLLAVCFFQSICSYFSTFASLLAMLSSSQRNCLLLVEVLSLPFWSVFSFTDLALSYNLKHICFLSHT